MQLVSAGLPHHIEHAVQVQTMDGGHHLEADAPVKVQSTDDCLRNVESSLRCLLFVFLVRPITDMFKEFILPVVTVPCMRMF